MDKLYKYHDIYSDIKRDILTNHYRAGTLLPTQDFFAKKYDVSRITLKKALNLLENEGLIFSKQGSGTYVRKQIDNDSSDLLPLDLPIGTTYSHRDQKISSTILHFDARLADKKEQEKLGIEASSPVYEFKRVRSINDQLYSYEHVVMPVYIAPLDEKILQGSVYDYLGTKAKLQLTDAHRTIYAEEASNQASKALQIEEGSPVLVIEQVAYDQKGRSFEFSKSVFKSSQSKFILDVHMSSDRISL